MKRVSSLINIGAFHIICILFMVNAHCTSFEFPTVDKSMTYRVPIHSPVSLPFKLDTTSCTNVKGCGTFSISSQEKATAPFTLVCTFNRINCNHFCVTPLLVSVCGNEKWYSSFNLTMETSNVTLLKWSCHDTGIAPDTFINFAFENVTTRPRDNNQTGEVPTTRSPTVSTDNPVDNNTTSSAFNESGNGTLSVAVESSTDDLSSFTHYTTTADTPGKSVGYVLPLVGVVVVLGVIVSLVAVIRHCKFRKLNSKRQAAQEPETATERESLGHVYQEIPDLPIGNPRPCNFRRLGHRTQSSRSPDATHMQVTRNPPYENVLPTAQSTAHTHGQRGVSDHSSMDSLSDGYLTPRVPSTAAANSQPAALALACNLLSDYLHPTATANSDHISQHSTSTDSQSVSADETETTASSSSSSDSNATDDFYLHPINSPVNRTTVVKATKQKTTSKKPARNRKVMMTTAKTAECKGAPRDADISKEEQPDHETQADQQTSAIAKSPGQQSHSAKRSTVSRGTGRSDKKTHRSKRNDRMTTGSRGTRSKTAGSHKVVATVHTIYSARP